MPREDVERRFTAIHPRIAGYFDLILTSESYANPTHEERRKTGITDIVNQSEKFPDLFFGNKTLLYDNSTWPDRTAKKEASPTYRPNHTPDGLTTDHSSTCRKNRHSL